MLPDPENFSGDLVRPRFFDRQELNAADLNAMIDYFRETLRRHNRALVGEGVACGLETSRTADPWAVKVGPGRAVLPSGDEIGVPEPGLIWSLRRDAEACLGLGEACRAPEDLTAPAEPGEGADLSFSFSAMAALPEPDPRRIAPWLTAYEAPHGDDRIGADQSPPPRLDIVRHQLSIVEMKGLKVFRPLALEFSEDVAAVELSFYPAGNDLLTARATNAAGVTVASKEVFAENPEGAAIPRIRLRLEGLGIRRVLLTHINGLLLDVSVRALKRGRLWLALFAAEKEADHRPVPPAPCRPPDGRLEPARICEGARLATLRALPERARLPTPEALEALICGGGTPPCPPPPAPGENCVILAEVSLHDFGIFGLDAVGPRRRLLPLAALADQARRLCGEGSPEPIPAPEPIPPPTPLVPPPPPAPSRSGPLPLERLSGLNPRDVDLLRRSGVLSLQDLAARRPEELTQTLSLSRSHVARFQTQARKLIQQGGAR